MSFAVPPTSILNYWLNQSNNHASIQIILGRLYEFFVSIIYADFKLFEQ